MKKSIFKILAFCGVLCLTSCDYGNILYVNLDDTVNTAYVVRSIEKLYGESNEQKNLASYKALNKYGCKLYIRANADSLSYGDTIIITKK